MHANLVAPVRRVAAILRPKPNLTPSQWADRHRRLSSLSTPEPGPWVTARVPYTREIMDAFGLDCDTEWVIFRTGTQVGKTEVLLSVLFYFMHWFPRPIAFVLPNEQACADVSEQRIDDGIKASPALRRLVGGQHSKDAEGRKGKDSILGKKFPGGMLFMLPATSKSALASKPCGVLLLDEINRYPRELAGEPDPVGIVEHRSQNFLERKIGLVSTPTDEDDSPICDWYAKTDQCVYDVPCPACGVMQPLKFRKVPGELGGVVWPEGEPNKARYECSDCGDWISHDRKQEMLAAGSWRATAAPTLANSRGFHLNALYSPWVSWAKLAVKFTAAQSDPVAMRDFVTLDLAEAWRHASGEVIDEHELAQRAADGWGAGEPIEVPGAVQVLTSFCDVQDDRLEVAVWGWDARNRGWLIGYWILWGDPATKGAPVWGDLASLLARQFRTPGGMLGITAGGIDSGAGSHTDAVYTFVRSGGWQKRRQFATKGLSSRMGVADPRPIWPQAVAKKKGTATVKAMNVNAAKYHLHLRLAKPGIIHFPKRTAPALPEGWYSQLCAEELVRTAHADGRSVRVWRLRKGIDRNEALDTMVGAYAAFVGLDRRNIPPPCGERTDLPANVGGGASVAAPAPIAPPKPPPAPAAKPITRQGKDLWRRLRS